MKESTRALVEQWWRDVFDVSSDLWSTVTVLHPHGLLGDYEGWYVAWRGEGVHVSEPSNAEPDELSSLGETPSWSLQDVGFWHAFAQQRGLEIVGPGVHRYLDVDHGMPDAVRHVETSTLLELS